MVLSSNEAEDIKKHLLKKLGSFPQDKRELIKEKIESMPDTEVEDFIKENKLTHLGNQCIFCSIISNKTPSFKILEDKDYLAVLEINPFSKGHTLILPKSHEGDINSNEAKNFAKEIARLLVEKLSPKEVKMSGLKIMDHPILEIIPIFGDEKERWQATDEELKSLQEEIIKPIQPVKIEEKKEIIEEPAILYKLPPRIP
jgi:hypothetical protein